MPRYAAIIECFSNGRYYIDDAVSSGLTPLMVYRKLSEDESRKEHTYCQLRDEIIAESSGKSEVLFLPDSPECIAKTLKGYDVACIVAGSEFGVGTADAVSSIMGLRGNSPESTKSRISKFGMHSALKKAGLRYLRSRKVESDEDIDKFWNDNGIRSAVIKFSVSTASNVRKCDSADEAKKIYSEFKGSSNFIAYEHEIMIQEYVHGKEYIVNTMSFEGRHKIMHIWHNDKHLVGDAGISQDRALLAEDDFSGRDELERYSVKMLNALGVEFGPAHSELCIDENGPVLIELNARVMGGFFPKNVLDEAFGDHISDISLECYLGSEKISDYMSQKASCRSVVLVKYISLRTASEGDPTPFFELAKKMRGYRGTSYEGRPGIARFGRTVDLFSSPFQFVFCDPDRKAIEDDDGMLDMFEYEFVDLMIVPPSHSERATAEIYRELIASAGKMAAGTEIRVPSEVCSLVPYGVRGMQMILRVLGITTHVDCTNGLSGMKDAVL